MDLTRIKSALVPPSTSLFAAGQPYDLVSLADVKLELDVTETRSDAYLQKLITRASKAEQKYCNRTFVPALWQEQVWPASGPFPYQLPPSLTRLALGEYPISAPANPTLCPPPQAPALGVAYSAGLPLNRYYVRLTYVTANGESAASLELSFLCGAGQGFSVPAPGADPFNLATGYNVYASTSSYAETLQNATPIGVNSGWSLPSGGLVEGVSPPTSVTIVETPTLSARPLAEGVDFLIDRENGFVDRLWHTNRQPKPWGLPAAVVYPAGFSTMPEDLIEATILLVKMRWFARGRDPMLRSEAVDGVYTAAYWLGTGIGGQGDLPVEVTEKLDRYRTPVVA